MPPMAHYPQQPPHFLLSPMPQPVPQPPQLPQLYIPQQPPTPAPLFVQQSPTEKEKEQLKIFDAHFNKTVKPKTVRVTSASSEESQEKPQEKPQENMSEGTTTKVKIAITRHVCGDCGRLRSRKYHHDHPLKPGEVPEVAFCRKCQKDASSTSEASEAEEAQKSKKKGKFKATTKKAKAPRKKPVESSDDDDDDESSDSPGVKPPRKPKPDLLKPSHSKKSAAKKATSEDYIVVEEEWSDHERVPRGRSHSRASREHSAPRRPLSPMASQLSTIPSRSRSYMRPSRQECPEDRPHPTEIHEVFRETVRPRSPHIHYRYVEVVPSQASFERDEPSNSKSVPVRLFDETVYEKPVSSKFSQCKEGNRERASSSKAYSVEEPESVARSHRARVDDFDEDESAPSSRYETFEVREASSRGPPSKYNSFEVPDTISSLRSSDARRRRKRERASPGTSNFRPWADPHVIHPEGDDEVVVVTEIFENRKKKQTDEEERRRQEYIDRATLSPRKNCQFSAEQAARYYRDDWSRAEPEFAIPSLVGKPYQPYQPAKARKGYRRDRHPNSELTESEASYDYDEHPAPRAPSPPSSIYQSKVNDWSGLKHTDWGDEPPYPMSSGSEYTGRRGEVVHMPHIDIPRRHRSNSNARYGGSEKALVLSPRHSSERHRDSHYEHSESDRIQEYRDRFDDFSVSNMTELERQAEVEARHVTFRNTPSIRSLHDDWGTSEKHSQWSRSDHDGHDSGAGWEDGGGNSGGAW
ncbi:hypothetical protein BKA64DRAFT_55418 [Cadophora sp. MPI-SDFR-AT-0126]|nr:hypothetical protein BKA64DRAFT_55418 [Leotiomycetes sp. MPI-SDFR-AT-0126]